MWTKDTIQDLLRTNDRAVERAVVALYKRQTADEQRDSDTKHDNKRGYRANHAPTLSLYARIIMKGWAEDNRLNRGTTIHLFPEKLEKARRFCMQYHRQLCEIANSQ